MVDVISQFLTSGSKLTDAIELFGTDFELANISIATILVTLLTAAVCGAVIYLVYRFFNRSVIYNENFNILVILTTIVTSFIIMTISSNVVLSLGMVGALSIVRFRTAIKDPMDTVFMFWSIVTGIITGAGYITVAILAALLLGKLTNGWTDTYLFSVWHSSLSDILTYPRFFLHVLGHVDYDHYIGNMMMILVVGPGLEEKYASRNLLSAIVITALVSGLVYWFLFPGSMLMGASGIVFMMIVMASLAGMRDGCIPITLILVLILYLGSEIVDGVMLKDNVSQLTHIIGGVCGAVLGLRRR